MKRALLITDIFPPDIGGPATFVPALASELAASGHAVTIFCRADDPAAHSANEWPFRVLRMPRYGGAVGKARLMASLFREALRHDVIFCNGLERQTDWVCRTAQRPYALKVVGDVAWERARNAGLTRLSIDDFQQTPPEGEPVRTWVARRASFARRARLVITPSDYLRQMVVGWGVEARRVVTVRNGVRLDEFARFAPRRRAGGVFAILFVGRLVNWKGVDHLLKAIAPLTDVRLSILGEGPEESLLRTLAGSLGLDQRVEFYGALPAPEVLNRLECAHVLALPSEYEGMSHTLLEACAAAVPCVASDRGGNPEVIEHERSGLLVPCGDVLQLRAALWRLQADEGSRFALAQGAKARSRVFDFRTTVAETVGLLQSKLPQS
jgi:glycosyltransferase involved in cell wall biosynthesis